MSKVVENTVIHYHRLLVAFIEDCEPEIFTTIALNLQYQGKPRV